VRAIMLGRIIESPCRRRKLSLPERNGSMTIGQGRDAVNRWLEMARDGAIVAHDVPRQKRRE
jgi:hypothetical protein